MLIIFKLNYNFNFYKKIHTYFPDMLPSYLIVSVENNKTKPI